MQLVDETSWLNAVVWGKRLAALFCLMAGDRELLGITGSLQVEGECCLSHCRSSLWDRAKMQTETDSCAEAEFPLKGNPVVPSSSLVQMCLDA